MARNPTGIPLDDEPMDFDLGDLSRAGRRRLGRPSLGSGVSPRMSFRASPALYEAARARAARENRSVSDLAREAVERYVVG